MGDPAEPYALMFTALKETMESLPTEVNSTFFMLHGRRAWKMFGAALIYNLMSMWGWSITVIGRDELVARTKHCPAHDPECPYIIDGVDPCRSMACWGKGPVE